MPKPIDVEPLAREKFLGLLVLQTAKGHAKYGKRLHTFNGRNAARDAMEELVDAFQYVTQLEFERDVWLKALSCRVDDCTELEMQNAALREHIRAGMCCTGEQSACDECDDWIPNCWSRVARELLGAENG